MCIESFLRRVARALGRRPAAGDLDHVNREMARFVSLTDDPEELIATGRWERSASAPSAPGGGT